MSSSNYYMLISSLPALPVHFEAAEQVPISRLRLDDRLQMLSPDDAEVIQRMADFLVWDRQPLDVTDEAFCGHYDSFLETVKNAFSRQWMEFAMTGRTIFSALRRRRLGMDPPPGVGWVAEHIARHWDHPEFRLTTQFPWIGQVDEVLRSDSPFELERKQFDIVWRHAKRLADQYSFSFEALLLYLIRWEIVFRWTSRDAVAGQRKFEQLVDTAMGRYANMFENDE